VWLLCLNEPAHTHSPGCQNRSSFYKEKKLLRSLQTWAWVTPLLLAGCGGGGGGGADDGPATPAPPVTTPASATFPAGSAYRAYVASARQQTYQLMYLDNLMSACPGSVTLTETAAVPATFEGNAAQTKTVTWRYNFQNCTQSTLTRTTDLFLNGSNDRIGGSPINPGYIVLDRPLELPASVKVGDTGTLATGTIYSNSTKANRIGTVTFAYTALADSRSDSILVRLEMTTGERTETLVYRLTTGGTMELRGGLMWEGNSRLQF
jgi:hypothetical protein